MTDLPIIMTSQGPQPRAPADILAALLALVAASNPGYTANLPGILIEDVSSTDVFSIAQIDQACVDAINGLTPRGANAFLLLQLGDIYGVAQGQQTNTSVYVVFSGPPGFVIAKGFVVSDGNYQYVVQDGGIIGSGGVSAQLFCLATIPGTWSIGTGTVIQLITSVPSGITITVTNTAPGTPGADPETEESYRGAVIQAGQAVAQGMSTLLKTALRNVSGVQPRLVSTVQGSGSWMVIVGGGDPYEVAYAIFSSLFDVASLVGSVIGITNITKASAAVVTTTINHGYTTGETVTITGVVGMTQINGLSASVTVIDLTHFSIAINSSGFSNYTSGGVCSPNSRNIVVSINDFPDTYTVQFVNPPQQSVQIAVTWNTIASNFVSASAIEQAASPALVDYINQITVGLPINLFELQATFQQAVATILPAPLLTRMVFSVSIDNVATSPDSGTGIIAGDPESFFLTDSTQITITQG